MKLRNHVTTIALLLAVAATGAYVLLDHSPRTTELDSLVPALRRDALTSLAFEREGSRFSLVRAAQDADAGDDRLWSVEQDGKRELADQFAVDKALQAFEYARPLRTIKPEEIDRQTFGLTSPRLKLTLVRGKLKTTVLVGGEAAKPEGAVYVEIDGVVSVLSKSTLAPLDLPADAFRTRTLVPYLSTELAGMVVSREGRSFTLARVGNITWKLEGGEFDGLRVDRQSFDRLLTALADMKADQFITDAEATKVQQGEAPVTLSMTPKEATRPKGELVVGGVCPGHPDEVVVVRRAPSPLFACSPRSVFDALARPAESYLDRRAFSLREDEVEEVHIEQGARKIELARKDTGWHQRLPAEADVSNDAAKQLVKALTSARSLDAPSKAGAFEPVAKVTLHPVTEDGAVLPDEAVQIGKEAADGRVPLRREQDGALLWVTREDARAFLPRESSLRALQIVDQPIDQARKLEVTSAEVTQTLERPAGGVWSITTPKDYEIDVGVATELVEAIAHLSAEQWVSDVEEPAFGLAKPRLKVALTVGDEGERKVYRVDVGASGPLGDYARLEGTPGVFVLPRSFEQTMTQWALDRAALMVDVGEVQSVSLQRPGQAPLVLLAQGDQFKIAPGGPELPQARLDALQDALRELRAEAVVHLGAPQKSEGFDKPTLEVKLSLKDGGKSEKIVIGLSDAHRDASIFFARRDGIEAVFALPAAKVRALLALL